MNLNFQKPTAFFLLFFRSWMFLHIKMEVQCLLGQRVPFLKKEKRKRIFPIQCRCVKGQIEQVPYNINRLLFFFFRLSLSFRFALSFLPLLLALFCCLAFAMSRIFCWCRGVLCCLIGSMVAQVSSAASTIVYCVEDHLLSQVSFLCSTVLYCV